MAYCRIDELLPEDEPVLEEMYQAALSYMEEAGVSEPENGTPRRAKYNLCVNALVLDDWDRRGTMDAGKSTYQITENKSFRKRLNQLKLTEPLCLRADERSCRHEEDL